VWMFSSGPTGKGNPVELIKGWLFPKSLQPVTGRIHPKDIALFQGALNMEKLNLIKKWMIKKVEAPLGDFHDWDAITSWAKAIADLLNDKGSASET
jgi:menaquinone-dependent protoporphyrinogen oxidase